jgi:hypothetical protein
MGWNASIFDLLGVAMKLLKNFTRRGETFRAGQNIPNDHFSAEITALLVSEGWIAPDEQKPEKPVKVEQEIAEPITSAFAKQAKPTSTVKHNTVREKRK